MAIRASFDAATRVSPELSAIIEKLVNDPDREEPPSLKDVRAFLKEGATREYVWAEALHPQDRTSALAEINVLIEDFGKEALAIDFVTAKASEGRG